MRQLIKLLLRLRHQYLKGIHTDKVVTASKYETILLVLEHGDLVTFFDSKWLQDEYNKLIHGCVMSCGVRLSSMRDSVLLGLLLLCAISWHKTIHIHITLPGTSD